MNVARKLEGKNDYYTNQHSRKVIKTNEATIITLVSNESLDEKKVTLEYLNEKLAYFYNNGGPIMDI